jgi:type II secretory pathway component PulC
MKISKHIKIYIGIGILLLVLSGISIKRKVEKPTAPRPVFPIFEFDKPEKKEALLEPSKRAPVKYPNLSLEGTVISGKPSAYIRDLDSQKAAYYMLGDKILNATLVDVKRGMVTLEVEGERYNLYLESEAPYGKSPFEEVSPSFRIVREDDLFAMVNSDEGTPNPLAELVPHKNRRGNFVGYKVEGVKPGSLAFLAGLRNGDIVNKVNNQKLLTQQKAIQTFRKVRKVKNIEIGLLRESKTINLKYKVK